MAKYDIERIASLREKAIQPAISYHEFYNFFNAHYYENHGNPSFKRRIAEAVKYAYENWTVSIDPDELIVGRPAFREYTSEENERFRRANEAYQYSHCAVGQDSHMAIDYDKLLWVGTSGIRAGIDKRIACLDRSDPESVRKEDFYLAAKTALEGLEILSERYASHAEELAENDPEHADHYREIARICRKVPKYPAETFREAVQSAAFVSYAISVKPLRPSMLQFQLGHPDRYLYTFYKKDKEAGRLTDEEAQTLVDCLCIQINRRVPNGLSCGLMVGGRDEYGVPVLNELTDMFLCAIDQVKLVYPSVGFCWTSDTPDEKLAFALSILAKGHSHPAIFNDDVIQAGLRYYGLSEQEACEYIHSTCVEITPCASSNVWVASPYMNLPGELLAVLPDDGECSDMDALWAKYTEHIRCRIEANYRQQVLFRYERAKYCADPLLSCFVHDCLEKGVDIEEGGARYNWIMPSFVGVSNAADALYTIHKLIYEKGDTTFAELKSAMADNYENSPALLAKINALPKYGNDVCGEDSPDAYVKRLSEFIADTCEGFRVPMSGDRLIPSLFCWIMHDQFGRCTGATPDGRLAGFPLGDGSGPAQGREAEGPTASVLSSTSWDHKRFIGGIAVNMKFAKSLFDETKLPALTALVKTYLVRGGFEMQINVTDRAILEKARQNPELYKDLVVRIGGYSDYFTRLSPTMQDEVMLRTEHAL